jgi:hypothetical protein
MSNTSSTEEIQDSHAAYQREAVFISSKKGRLGLPYKKIGAGKKCQRNAVKKEPHATPLKGTEGVTSVGKTGAHARLLFPEKRPPDIEKEKKPCCNGCSIGFPVGFA